MRKQLVITADDFGIDSPTNRAVVCACKEGLISCASIMPTALKYAEAVRLAKKHGIPVGVHVAITWGTGDLRKEPLTAIPSIGTGTPDEVACEAGTQIYRVWRDGLDPRYWDSHKFAIPGDRYGPMVSEISRASCLPFVDHGKGSLPKGRKFPKVSGAGSIMPGGVLTEQSIDAFLGSLEGGVSWTWSHISTRGVRAQYLAVLGKHLKRLLSRHGVELVRP